MAETAVVVRANDKGEAQPAPPAPPTTRSEPPAALGGGNSLTRVTVNLLPRTMAALERMSTEGSTKTDVINKSIMMLELVQQLLDEEGGTLTIKRNDGTESRLYIL